MSETRRHHHTPAVRALAIAVALLAGTAVLLQLGLSIRLAQSNGRSIGWGVVTYLGYFTILTNLLVTIAAALPIAVPETRPGRFFARPSVATAVAAAILLVGTAYHLLLRNIWDPQGLSLVADVMLHYLVPVLYLIYWLVAVPTHDIRWSDIPHWTIYPIGYFIYALIRGAILQTYPYPFIDVTVLGYGVAVRNALGVLAAYLLIATLLVLLGRLRDRHLNGPRSST